jgi:aspartate-semialdehyde dehydrogenase
MSGLSVAVVGATGAVGRRMVRVLEERRFPIRELRLFASERSAGTKIAFSGTPIRVESLAATDLSHASFDLALLSAGAAVSRDVSPALARAGTLVVDNSSAFRLQPDVPLVIPEVNGEDARDHRGLIAVPNCSTIQMLVVLAPLHRRWRLHRVIVSTYQSVSGKGQRGIEELAAQERDPAHPARTFHRRIRGNVIPLIDAPLPDGSTKEERKMLDETRKILHEDRVGVIATCVRVPVPIGHSEAIVAEFAAEPDAGEARRLLEAAHGVRVVDDLERMLVPVAEDCVDRDEVFVGRIRRDASAPRSLALWCVADNLRKGAATNAVQIAESVLTRALAS